MPQDKKKKDVKIEKVIDFGKRLFATVLRSRGEKFPHEKIQHDHTSNSFLTGMKVISSAVYQYGKVATISSRIVKENDNKLLLARDDVDVLIDEYFVDVFLFDSWYCKSPLLEKIRGREKNIYLALTNR